MIFSPSSVLRLPPLNTVLYSGRDFPNQQRDRPCSKTERASRHSRDALSLWAGVNPGLLRLEVEPHGELAGATIALPAASQVGQAALLAVNASHAATLQHIARQSGDYVSRVPRKRIAMPTESFASGC